MASPLAEPIKKMVLARLHGGDLKLPSMAGVASQAARHLRRHDAELVGVVAIVQTDPLLAATIVYMANSGAYGSRPAECLASAVNRVGAGDLAAKLMDVAGRTFHDSADPDITTHVREIWEHCVGVALIARDVAALVSLPNPEEAYLSGLLHDIGKVVAGIMLLEAERAVRDSRQKQWISADVFKGTIREIHAELSQAIAESWNFPDGVREPIVQGKEFDSAQRKSAHNIARYANALVKQQGISPDPIDQDEVAALLMVGKSLLEIEEEIVVRLTSALKQRIRAQLPI